MGVDCLVRLCFRLSWLRFLRLWLLLLLLLRFACCGGLAIPVEVELVFLGAAPGDFHPTFAEPLSGVRLAWVPHADYVLQWVLHQW